MKNTLLNIKQKQILDGLLLGDGGISISSKNPVFGLTSITKSFIDDVKQQLPFGWCPIYSREERTIIRNKKTVHEKKCYKLTSHIDNTINLLYNKWYKPNKQVPKNLILTPLVVKYWFYGDGSTTWITKNKNLVSLTLYTNNFSVKDVEYLIKRLEIDCGLNGFKLFKINNILPIIKTKNTILINKFFNFIGSNNINDFQYKWKIPFFVGKQSNSRNHILSKKTIIIDNIKYNSYKEAAIALKVNRRTIYDRVKRGIYLNE